MLTEAKRYNYIKNIIENNVPLIDYSLANLLILKHKIYEKI